MSRQSPFEPAPADACLPPEVPSSQEGGREEGREGVRDGRSFLSAQCSKGRYVMQGPWNCPSHCIETSSERFTESWLAAGDSHVPQAVSAPVAVETPKITKAVGGSSLSQDHRQDPGFNQPLQPQEKAVV